MAVTAASHTRGQGTMARALIQRHCSQTEKPSPTQTTQPSFSLSFSPSCLVVNTSATVHGLKARPAWAPYARHRQYTSLVAFGYPSLLFRDNSIRPLLMSRSRVVLGIPLRWLPPHQRSWRIFEGCCSGRICQQLIEEIQTCSEYSIRLINSELILSEITHRTHICVSSKIIARQPIPPREAPEQSNHRGLPCLSIALAADAICPF